MSRYLGPKHKLCRRLGVKVCDAIKCPLARRNYPPGMHGPTSRLRLTAYGQQFREKQRARRTYGLSERQFSNYYRSAVQEKGDSGIHLARMLEMRLDNVIYRLRWATTRPQARQMVSHGFIQVNGKRVDIPSYQVKTKDLITVKPSKREMALLADQSSRADKQRTPEWLHLASVGFEAKVISVPDPELLKGLFNGPAVVELYSR